MGKNVWEHKPPSKGGRQDKETDSEPRLHPFSTRKKEKESDTVDKLTEAYWSANNPPPDLLVTIEKEEFHSLIEVYKKDKSFWNI